jgi:hypothetical protein
MAARAFSLGPRRRSRVTPEMPGSHSHIATLPRRGGPASYEDLAVPVVSVRRLAGVPQIDGRAAPVHIGGPMAKLTCRFIAGDPSHALQLGDALYCGQPVARPGDSYCEEHRKICCRPTRHDRPPALQIPAQHNVISGAW